MDSNATLRALARGIATGAAATAAMSLAYATERRLRPRAKGPLDYDDSLVPGQIVASVLHLPSVTAKGDYELGMLLRWGYGSAFGVAHVALRRSLGEPRASLAFGGLLMSATLSLFPVLGRTPPPWRWPAATLLTSVGTHAVYVTTAALVDAALDRGSSAR
jgi:hypothetical protein